jgi:hypothetical protein
MAENFTCIIRSLSLALFYDASALQEESSRRYKQMQCHDEPPRRIVSAEDGIIGSYRPKCGKS